MNATKVSAAVSVADYSSPVGSILIAEKSERLIGLWIEKQNNYLGMFDNIKTCGDDCRVLADTKRWLDRYFSGEKPSPTELELAPIGSKFRQTVWNILLEIPYGETISYGEIARKIASQRCLKKMSAQAVGGAVGHNPISIIIPCHRVIGSDGGMTGYNGGIDIKIKLLEHENHTK